MPKKKPKKRPAEKPLLALTGILHLEKSFVPPTNESGLLTTVGGANMEGQALVLAPNYGYGIHASEVSKVLENQHKNITEEPPNVIDVNGVKMATTDKNLIELNQDFPLNPISKENLAEARPEELSIAELVRSIGGAQGKPFMRSDVIEDEKVETAEDVMDEKENHTEEQEFYESLGLRKKSKATVEKTSVPQSSECAASVSSIPLPGTDNTQSIADYYKTYCRYYFSAETDPLGDKPLEFGIPINVENGKEPDGSEDSVINLAKMAQRARRAMEAARKKAQTVYGPHLKPQNDEYYDPLPMEVVPNETSDGFVQSQSTSMDEYWNYVKENPRDFNRWTYLVQHAENTQNLHECRKAYSAFLPLYPYCFGYWKRYAEIEKGRMYYQRALSVLKQGLEFNPLSIDLWQSYLSLYREVYGRQDDFQDLMRMQYEQALTSTGLEFRSDALWDQYIEWEMNNKRLRHVFALYQRLLKIPTRLYNRHWDNIKAFIRDHHPRDFLEKVEYESMRKKGCKLLGYRYREEPEYEPGEIIKTSKPEDKLMNHVKEKIITKLEKRHKTVAAESDKRWDFEDKIRRPYFHVKPLDNGQLRNWENYLNFEISEGCHDRTVLLFERCLIACALYERYWCQYARYLEKYHRQDMHKDEDVSPYFQKPSSCFDIGNRKEILEEEELVFDVTEVLKTVIDTVVAQEEAECNVIRSVVDDLVDSVCNLEASVSENFDEEYSNFVSVISGNPPIVIPTCSIPNDEVQELPSGLSGNSQNTVESPPNAAKQNSNKSDTSSLTSVLSVPVFPKTKNRWQEIIRDVYKRACVVHCPRKPMLRLQWAAFEEEIGNIGGARQLIQQVLDWFPDTLDAKSQLIELERRAGRSEEVVRLFEQFSKEKRSIKESSVLALKYARFLFKEQAKAEQALAVLRKSIRKDKGNHLLYAYVFDICYQRFPADRKGAAAALELAIQSKEIDDEQKLFFLRKKVLFLQEHGELAKYRDALDSLYELRDKVAKAKADTQEKDMAVMRENLARSRALSSFQPSFPQPQVPVSTGQEQIPISFEALDPSVTSGLANSVNEQVSAYKRVPPTDDLLDLSSYGYSRNHPDFKMQENQYQSEYDKLIGKGYRPDLLDQNQPESSNTKERRRKVREIPTYIVPPRGEFLRNYLHSRKPRNRQTNVPT